MGNGRCLTAAACLIFMVVRHMAHAQSVEDGGCQTPEGEVGACVLVKDCRPFVDFLAKIKRPFSNAVRDKLKKFTCGYSSSSVKVCCPNGPISLDDEALPLSNTGGPPDVSNHRNLRLLPRDCGFAFSTDKITNGENANLGEFPWMANIAFKTDKGIQFRCGGTILNKNYILTAAHCITKTVSPLAGVRVGEHDLSTDRDCVRDDDDNSRCNPPVQNLDILEIIPHEQFGAGRYKNDVGLLRVSTINFARDNVRPVCMPLKDQANFNLNRKNVIVTGWGITENYTSSNILQKAGIPVVPLTTCQEAYKSYGIDLDIRQMCAGGGIKDTCAGDSGGPLIAATYLDEEVRYVQHGIVSFGPKICGREIVPGVYSKVAYYMDWILDHIRP